MAADLLLRHLALIHTPATDEQLADLYTPDATLELVYAPEGHTRRKEGPREIADFLGRIPTYFRDFALSPPTVYPTPDGFVAEYHAESVNIETGRAYAQDYIAVVTLQDGRIRRIREYYDPLRVLRAIGDLD